MKQKKLFVLTLLFLSLMNCGNEAMSDSCLEEYKTKFIDPKNSGTPKPIILKQGVSFNSIHCEGNTACNIVIDGTALTLGDSIDYLESIENACKENASFFHHYAIQLSKINKYEAANKILEKAINNKIPKFEGLYIIKGDLMLSNAENDYKSANFEDIKKTLDLGYSLNPKNSDRSFESFALYYYLIDDKENFERTVREGVASFKTLKLYIWFAVLEHSHGNLDKTIAMLGKIKTQKGNLVYQNPYGVFSLIDSICKVGRPDIAKSTLEEALYAYPGNILNPSIQKARDTLNDCKPDTKWKHLLDEFDKVYPNPDKEVSKNKVSI